MSEPKPFASLSSGLLARKGGAKPAMRPQGFSNFSGNLEDLGWNDMGHAPGTPEPESFDEMQEHVPSSISALTPAPKAIEAAPVSTTPVPVEQQRTLAETFDAEVEEAPVDRFPAITAPIVVPAQAAFVPAAPAAAPEPARAEPRQRRAPGEKEKAAFTLRLDQERHLKLRLACAVKHRSAQQIVSQALDEFLQSLPELDALTQQLPSRSAA